MLTKLDPKDLDRLRGVSPDRFKGETLLATVDGQPTVLRIVNCVLADELDRTSPDAGASADQRQRLIDDLLSLRGAMNDYHGLLRCLGDSDPTTRQLVRDLLGTVEAQAVALIEALMSLADDKAEAADINYTTQRTQSADVTPHGVAPAVAAGSFNSPLP